MIFVDIQGFKQKYHAENPQYLEKILDEKKDKFHYFLNDFKKLYNKHDFNHKIKFYTGIKSIKNIYSDLLKEMDQKKDYLVIGPLESWLSIDTKFFENFLKKRISKNNNTRLLFSHSNISIKRKKFEKNFNEEIKILPKKIKLKNSLIITSKKLVMHNLGTINKAIVIEDENFIDMHRNFFEIMWNSVNK